MKKPMSYLHALTRVDVPFTFHNIQLAESSEQSPLRRGDRDGATSLGILALCLIQDGVQVFRDVAQCP
jgi:hypothetical protein